MALLYDLKLKSGEKIESCYFVKYEKPVKSGKGNIVLTYLPIGLVCFDKDGNKVLNINLEEAVVTKIYDAATGKDVTKKIISNYEQISKALGYYPDFPIPRETVIID